MTVFWILGGLAILVNSLCTVDGLVVGTGHTCVVLDNNDLKCFGKNDYGQLGLGDKISRGATVASMGDTLLNADLGTGLTVVALSAGSDHTCAILSDSNLKCFGKNDKGQLGLGDTNHRGDDPGEMGDNLPTVGLGPGRSAVAVMASHDFTCVILDTGKIKCWGDGEHGSLGNGNTLSRGTGTAQMGANLPVLDLGTGYKALSLGEGPCAIIDSGLKCWGKGVYGALGLGDMDSRGDDPGEMGENLPLLALGTGSVPAMVAGGRDYSCALMDTGIVKCWGRGEGGQLGNANIATIGDDPGEMGANLVNADLGEGMGATWVTTGFQHSCALLSTGGVKCWGKNFYGNLGQGDFRPRGHAPNTMGDSIPEVDFGLGRTAVTVAAGGERTCAILDNGELKCFGFNENGELGLGDTFDRGDDPLEMGDNLPSVSLGLGRTAVPLIDPVVQLFSKTVAPTETGPQLPLPTTRPVDGEPVDGEPVDGEPVDGEPVDGEPVDGEPVDGEDPPPSDDGLDGMEVGDRDSGSVMSSTTSIIAIAAPAGVLAFLLVVILVTRKRKYAHSGHELTTEEAKVEA